VYFLTFVWLLPNDCIRNFISVTEHMNTVIAGLNHFKIQI